MKIKLAALFTACSIVVAAQGLPCAANAETATPPPLRTLDVIQKSGEIHIAVYKDFAPFSSSENGVLKGVDVDIAKALGRVLGVNVAFKEQVPGESVNDDLRNAIWKGHYMDHTTADAMLHIPTDPALAKLNDHVTIFAPYYHEQIAVAGVSNAFDPDDGLDAFRKVQVGVETATMADMALLTEDNGALINNVHHFKNLSLAVKGMEKGDVAAVMGVRSELEGALGALKKKYPITPIDLPKYAHTSWDLGVAVDVDNAALAKALGDAFATLLADGTVEKIFAAYNLDYVAP